MNRGNILTSALGGCGSTIIVLFSWAGLCIALFLCAGLTTTVWQENLLDSQGVMNIATVTDVWYTQNGTRSKILNILYQYSVDDQKYYHVDQISPGIAPAPFEVGDTVQIMVMADHPETAHIVEPVLNNNRYRILNYGLMAGLGIFALVAGLDGLRRTRKRQ